MDRRKVLTAGMGALAGGLVAGAASAQTYGAQTYGTQTSSTSASDAETPQGADAAVRAAQAPTPVPAASLPKPPGVIDWAKLRRYHDDNARVATLPQSQRRVVMMGDSITDNWATPFYGRGFFEQHGLIGRGISGEVTPQMLVRFPAEVLALKPLAVHIMGGTNDVAENQDPYDITATTNYLQAMITLAKGAGIRVIMASVPPATSFSWKPMLGNRLEMIRTLNVWIKDACVRQGLTYCDYWPVLQGPDGGLARELGAGGNSVHPGPNGYAVMDPVLLAAIETALR